MSASFGGGVPPWTFCQSFTAVYHSIDTRLHKKEEKKEKNSYIFTGFFLMLKEVLFLKTLHQF